MTYTKIFQISSEALCWVGRGGEWVWVETAHREVTSYRFVGCELPKKILSFGSLLLTWATPCQGAARTSLMWKSAGQGPHQSTDRAVTELEPHYNRAQAETEWPRQSSMSSWAHEQRVWVEATGEAGQGHQGLPVHSGPFINTTKK